MTSKTFARIQDGAVAEIFSTTADIKTLFHPSLIWVDVTNLAQVHVGWTYDGATFSAPAAVTPPPVPSLADLQAQLRTIQTQIETLTSGR